MRAYLPDYRVVNPDSLDEALQALEAEDDARPLAGGTDIMVYMEAGEFEPCTLINLYSIEELHGSPVLNDGLHMGPLSTYRHTREQRNVSRQYPMLATAAREISVLALQSRATWAGNIANASPAADGVPALMAYDAELELSSLEGQRTVGLDEFYRGYKQMDLGPDELITGIHLPPSDDSWKEYYRKVGTRRFQAISKTLLAARIKFNRGPVVEDVRLSFASVAPYTLRARRTEDVLRGEELSERRIERALESLQDEIKPIEDIRSTAAYRRRVSGNLLRDFLQNACPAD